MRLLSNNTLYGMGGGQQGQSLMLRAASARTHSVATTTRPGNSEAEPEHQLPSILNDLGTGKFRSLWTTVICSSKF